MRSLAPEGPRRPRPAVHAGESRKLGESPPKAPRFPCRGREAAKGAQVASDAGASRLGRRQERRRKKSGRREADAVTPRAQVGTHTNPHGRRTGDGTQRNGQPRTPPRPVDRSERGRDDKQQPRHPPRVSVRLLLSRLSPFPPPSLSSARSLRVSLLPSSHPPHLLSSLFACPRKEPPGGNGVSAAGAGAGSTPFVSRGGGTGAGAPDRRSRSKSPR